MEPLHRAREQRRLAEVVARWPALREEAHRLHTEARDLTAQLAALRRETAGLAHEHDRAEARRRKLERDVARLRARIEAIERSRGWRIVTALRGARHRARHPLGGAGRTRAAAARPAPEHAPAGARSDGAPSDSPPVASPSPAPAWRVALDAVHAWAAAAREAPGDVVLALTAEPADARAERILGSCSRAGIPVVLLDMAEPAGPAPLVHALAPSVRPSVVPHALAADLGARARLFLALAPTDAALRWLVPAQQEGWTAVVDLAEVPGWISPEIAYLASHADAVCAPATGPGFAPDGRGILPPPADGDEPVGGYLRAAASAAAAPPLIRRVLGIARP